MVKAEFLRGWIGKLAAMLAILTAATWQDGALGQGPMKLTGENVRLLKSRVFYFPVRIDPDMQTKIQQVTLYMREGPGPGPWVQVDSVSPLAKSIQCQVPRDGEFHFQVVTVDLLGRPSMTDFDSVPPAMIVFVNTSAQARPDPVINLAQHVGIPQPNAGSAAPTTWTESPSVPVVQHAPAQAADSAIVNQPRPVNKFSQAANSQTPGSSGSANRLLNCTRVSIDYNVRAGTSGIAKIDIWATADNGHSWQRLGEDVSHRNPIQAELPGEGVFGIRLVATNGTGFSGKSPVTGDMPTSTFEVDMTGPHIHALDLDPIAKNGILDIRWKVTDKNLGSEPINLYYSPQRNGPWVPIAVKVRNDDVYHWTLPRDVPPQMFFRIEATDMAGNASRCDTQTPLALDVTIPEIDVTGVQPAQGRRD